MGAEALCRGASYVVAIEQSSRAQPSSRTGSGWKARTDISSVTGDVVQRLKTLGQQFDRITDPPYASDSTGVKCDLLPVASSHRRTGSGTQFRRLEASTYSNLEICREKVYGNTSVTFYHPVTGG